MAKKPVKYEDPTGLYPPMRLAVMTGKSPDHFKQLPSNGTYRCDDCGSIGPEPLCPTCKHHPQRALISFKKKRPKDLVMWCMQGPDGKLIGHTISSRKDITVQDLFDLMPAAFRLKYWKRREATLRAYREMGYRAVKVRIIPLDSAR